MKLKEAVLCIIDNVCDVPYFFIFSIGKRQYVLDIFCFDLPIYLLLQD